jgi:DNA-binding transcriptional MerR regulator
MAMLTTKDVLDRFQIPYHRLAYLFSSRRVPEVGKTSSGCRLYRERDVETIRMALEDIKSRGTRLAQSSPEGRTD